jgi:hypothetical protein
MGEHLRRDKLLLQVTQNTLQGMLSSVFNPSAVCDGMGLLNYSSPQLCQLLNGIGRSATALWELGSIEEEAVA